MRFLLAIPLFTLAQAEELAIEPKQLTLRHVISANALPEEVENLRLDPKAWSAFKIVTIAKHGATIKKGETLVAFDSEEIDRKIAEKRRMISAASLGLDEAKQSLDVMEKTTPDELAKIERAAKIADEAFEYFTKTGRAAQEEQEKYSLLGQEQRLASEKEELKQLLQMYEKDDLTEETEEIILKNQKASVDFAEHALRMKKLSYKRTMEVELPREAISLELQRNATALAFENAKKDLPRSLKQKKLAVEEQEIAFEQMKKGLEDLEKDRGLFEIKAKSDGIFYYGSVADGKWTTGDFLANLAANSVVPTGKVFGSFLPKGKSTVIHAFVKQHDAMSLSKGNSGEAVIVGREDMAIPVKVISVSKTPEWNGTYQIEMEGVWPKDLDAVVGQELVVRLVSYSKKDALLVPTKALEYGVDGWTVDVKLADGKTERRIVKLGKSVGEKTEIVDGLEAGQVVIVP